MIIPFTNTLMEELDKQISHVETFNLDIITKSQRLSLICKRAVDDLKFHIHSHGFKNTNEEIHFFKNLKPYFLSKLYYYDKVYKIEINIGISDSKAQIKYFKDELRKVNNFCQNKKEIWTYYSKGKTDRDSQYFTRGNYGLSQDTDFDATFIDPSFASLHGKTIARLRGSRDLIVYLNQRIKGIKSSPEISRTEPFSLTFNGTPAEAIELGYALYKSKKVDNDIKQIITALSDLFGIDLKNFYQYFSNMKARKGERAKFMQLLKSSFENALDED
ncbi:MAG: RteC domain-containing protein [Saprospiraceae bacterium]|nr:RteC domain-containing protein [Saprospiraceae bacterium]